MSAQHTPGPWGIETGADRTPLVMADGKAVAHVYMQRTEVGRSAKEVETNANARLIAAAPDMLRALQMLADTGRMEDSEWWREALVARDAAIHKATGEQS